MGFSWALVCSTAFVLVLLSSASKDEAVFEQREVTFDLDKIMQDMENPGLQREVDPLEFFNPMDMQIPGLQREVDPLEFFNPMDMQNPDMMQREVNPLDRFDPMGGSRPGVLTPRGSRPSFGPRSFGGPIPALEYPVQFPPARPSSDNLQAICHHGDRRPRYPDSYFPVSGFGQLRRRATAINNIESWFSICCRDYENWGQEMTLCCATQAWELSVEAFCKEDSSVKDRLYSCCRQTGVDRLNCFHNDASNPSYGPTEELPVSVPLPPSTVSFSFNVNACQRTAMTPKSVKGNERQNDEKPIKVDISFPPGRPTADAIQSLCQNQRSRPLYTVSCLTDVGHAWLVRQAKAINRIERGYKKCCKKEQDVLNCADRKWREEINKYCLEKGKLVDFHCCYPPNMANDQYNCFREISPDPHYNLTSVTEELSLSSVCETHKIIKKKFPMLFSIKNIVKKCCPLSEQDKSKCIMQKLQEERDQMCISGETLPPNVRNCCIQNAQGAPQCLSKVLMDAITKAKRVSRRKKKCPIS